ncbi:actin nucleation-promoting factor WASL-like [Poecile atricapillus]|uniref:actin nucleation-promoting factor WASL-like n=1 Tax=Poecile atricapillus TaxID=48891 RepID=UPI002738E1AC|nr:actin nucleation-promoting factor WASL-like [Poecile atricapillus]
MGPDAPGLPPRPWSGSQDLPTRGSRGAPRPPHPRRPPHPPQQQLRGSDRLGLLRGGSIRDPPPLLWILHHPPPPPRGSGPGVPGVPAAAPPPSAEQRRSQKWLALEGLRDWYLRHAGTPPQPPAHPGWAQPPPPQRRRDPPGLPHSLSYAGALPRTSGDTPGTTPPPPLDPQPPGTLV